MLRNEVIKEWKNLKDSLRTKLSLFTQNKALIKDAVEAHLNFASSFLTEHSNPALVSTRNEVKNLSDQIEQLDQNIKELENAFEKAKLEEKEDEYLKKIKEEIEATKKEKSSLAGRKANLENWLDPTHPTIQAFEKQKVTNERIVKECQELLAKMDYGQSETNNANVN